jgi:hypothetical protein
MQPQTNTREMANSAAAGSPSFWMTGIQRGVTISGLAVSRKAGQTERK